jgi:hypothetical protein
VAGRIRPIEKSNDFIGIRTRYLPACNIVPQPTTLPYAPKEVTDEQRKLNKNLFSLSNSVKVINIIFKNPVALKII